MARLLVLTACLLVALAGCAQPGPAPTPEAAATSAADEGPASIQVRREGTVLLRAPGDGPLLQYTGDSPCFEFDLPSGTLWLNGTLSWTPAQTPMMLQFGNLETFEYHQTDDDVPLSGSITPPISLSVPEPRRGPYFAYMGPGAAGGGATFVLDFEAVLAPGFTQQSLGIRDSGC